MQTSEAERIGINQVAKVLPSGNDKGTDQRTPLPEEGAEHACRWWSLPYLCVPTAAVTAHFTSLHAALMMLTGRLSLLHGLLSTMAAGAAMRRLLQASFSKRYPFYLCMAL